MIRTVLGDRHEVSGWIYTHEHLIIDSPLIDDRWPHISLNSVAAAVEEVAACRPAGVSLLVDAMPVAAGRDVMRLAAISRQSGVDVVAATGLHHDRYYGPLHWSNRVPEDVLADLFIADLIEGVDRFDYTSPIVERTHHRAGIVKVATSGPSLDARDRRNLAAAAQASLRTGCPILTHCEGGRGAVEQVDALADLGVPASAVLLSHIDKAQDVAYALDVAATGAWLELDQNLRQHASGPDAQNLALVSALVDAGYSDQIIFGTDGARRSLWSAYGGTPGLNWLATGYCELLGHLGLADDIPRFFHDNPLRALTWRTLPESRTI